MEVLFEECINCGSTKTNSGLLSGICPNCGQERELVIGPGGNNYGEEVLLPAGLPQEDKNLLEQILKDLKENKDLKTVEDALEGG